VTAMAPEHPYARQVLALLAAVDVRPPDTYLWFGRREDGAGGPLVDCLADRLEREFFGAGGPLLPRGAPVTPPDDGGDFVRALSQANGARGAWQAGWRLGAPADDDDAGLTVVRPDGLRLLAPAEDCRIESEAAVVRLPKELRGWRPGALIALGDTPVPDGDRVALYWNVAAAGAVTLVARVTYALNGAGLAFTLELPANPARYDGRDSAVLTVARADFAGAIKLSRTLLRALGPHLADGCPALTKPLARGLAVAEAPRDGQRFGAARCRLIAEALVTAGERGRHGADARLAVVADHFAAAGLSLATPYLEPGSVDAYELS